MRLTRALRKRKVRFFLYAMAGVITPVAVLYSGKKNDVVVIHDKVKEQSVGDKGIPQIPISKIIEVPPKIEDKVPPKGITMSLKPEVQVYPEDQDFFVKQQLPPIPWILQTKATVDLFPEKQDFFVKQQLPPIPWTVQTKPSIHTPWLTQTKPIITCAWTHQTKSTITSPIFTMTEPVYLISDEHLTILWTDLYTADEIVLKAATTGHRHHHEGED